MAGGNLTNDKATTAGGGVYISSGSFNMTGGMISDNSAKWGGGVYACSGSSSSQSFRISNGSITGNTAAEISGAKLVLENARIK